MSKIVYYYKLNKKYYVRENFQEEYEGTYWAECPYFETETKKITDLAKSYTNALNSAEWLAEKEAKEAFLSAGEIIVGFFLTSDDAKKELLGEAVEGGENLVGGYGLSKVFDYIGQHIPDELMEDFRLEYGEEDDEDEENNSFLSANHKVRQAKKTGGWISNVNNLKKMRKNLNLEKQMAENIRSVGINEKKDGLKKLADRIEDNNKKLKDTGAQMGSIAGDFIEDYFSVWAPAVVTVMYDRKYKDIDWEKLKINDPARYTKLNKEIKNKIVFEARCNMFASDFTGWLFSLGIVLMKSGIKSKSYLSVVTLIPLGLYIVHLSQAISNGIKSGYREYLKQKNGNISLSDLNWSNIIELGLKETKKFMGEIRNKYQGHNTMYFTIPYNSERIIVKKSIDAPGFLGGLLSFMKTDSLDSLKAQLVNETLFNEENINSIASIFTDKEFQIDWSSIFTKDTQAKIKFKKGMTGYVGTMELLGDFYQNRIEDERDIEFVAIYDMGNEDDDIMEKLLHKFFDRNLDRVVLKSEQLTDYIKSPIFIRTKRGHSKASNRVVAYTHRVEMNGPEREKAYNNYYRGIGLTNEKPRKEFKRSTIKEKFDQYSVAQKEYIEANPGIYLEQLTEYFSEDVIKKMLDEGITIGGYFMVSGYASFYNITNISTFREKALEYGLDLEDNKELYDYIFGLQDNNFMPDENLIGNISDGSSYDYIAYDLENQYNIFGSSKDILYGSYRHEQDGTGDRFDFWHGVRSELYYKDNPDPEKNSNPDGNIYINGKKIGDNNKYTRLSQMERSYWDKFYKRFLYEQNIDIDGKNLQVRYTYDLNGGFLSTRHAFWTLSPFLLIDYRIKDGSWNEWSQIVIKEFSDGDFGINIPDKGEVLPGSRYKGHFNPQGVEMENINTEEVVTKGGGKIKIKDKYLKAKGISPLKVKDNRLQYSMKKGDTLWEVADLYYKDGSRWRELEKEDGSSFSDEEAGEIAVGTSIFIPQGRPEIIGYIDADSYKYFKDSEGNLYIKYIDENNRTETLSIPGFREGDYGLWVEEESPYYLDGEILIDRDWNEEVEKGRILELEDNHWLEEEERIADGFLWIYGGEEIEFPEEVEEQHMSETAAADELSHSEGNNSFQINQASSSSKADRGKREDADQKDGRKDSYSIPGVGKNGRKYVCHGAILQCTRGSAPCNFNIIDKYQIYIQGKPIATIDDNKIVNIASFGTCARQYSPPCTPKPVGKWQGGKNDVVVKDKPTLMDTSTLKCAFGGTIKVSNPGQQLLSE